MASRALVLGSGGLVGIAWEVGVLAGLAERGVNLREADLVVGTSAGALVGARLAAGLDIERMYEEELAPPDGKPAPRVSLLGVFKLLWAITRAKDSQEFGMRMGRIALAATTVPEQERQAEIAHRLGEATDWPPGRLLITAVDAESGEPATFAAGGEPNLVTAVAASTAGPGIRPPVTIGGRRYIDGGMRSPANADLAAGHARIVVIAPVTRGGGPVPGVEDQVAELARRSRVALVTPDPATWRTVTGKGPGGMLDPARRAPAAQAGRTHAAQAAATVAKVWNA
jgi:NTE family protein